MTIEAVVFDLDGVLVDSEPVWQDVRRGLVLERHGRWLPESQRRIMGMSTGEWSRYLSDELGVGLPPQEVAEIVISRMVDRYADGVPALPGAMEAVRRVASRWRLALASSSPPRLIDVVLDQMGLTELFAVRMSTEEVAHGKPAPDVYAAVADHLGADPRRCVAVEDSTNGVRSAHAAGMHVIAVPRPEVPPEADALALADRVLESLDQLTETTVADLG